MFDTKILGVVGTGLVAVAYIPQIVHLIKERCSAGISINAYALWFAASVLFVVHAIAIRDLVFTLLQVVNFAAIVVIVAFARRYRGQACASHQVRPPRGTRLHG